MATTKAANRKDEIEMMNLQDGYAVVQRETCTDGSCVYNVHLLDGDRSATFHAVDEHSAHILAQAINKCSGWAIR